MRKCGRDLYRDNFDIDLCKDAIEFGNVSCQKFNKGESVFNCTHIGDPILEYLKLHGWNTFHAVGTRIPKLKLKTLQINGNGKE